MTPLTDKQRAILAYIVEHTEAYGAPPAMREIGAKFGIVSTNGINDHLKAIERKGYIRRRLGKSRGIQVLCGPNGAPTPGVLPEAWRVELAEYRMLLRRVAEAGSRLPSLSAEMANLLGDVRAVLSNE